MQSVLILAMAALPAIATDFQVSVGAGGLLAYSPTTVQAVAGDTITFTFNPVNHTVTQSTFDSPCSPLIGGKDSGFQPTADGVGNTYTVSVEDATTPLWFYCAQTVPKSHCAAGMVFAINPPATGNTFAAFQALAEASASNTTTSAPATSASASATATSATSAATPTNHMITVGDNSQLAFSPSNISANLGDTITFEFHPKAHSATRSAFGTPCLPLANNAAGNFADTGLMPVDANATTFPTYSFTVNDTAPIWVYCKQTLPESHCGQGMVFSVNAVETGTNTFAAFQALAIAQNGTASTSGSASAPGSSQTGTSHNGAARTHATGLALALIVVAACFL